MNPLSWLVSPLVDGFKSWNDGRVKLKKANLDIQLAEKENKARLLRSREDNNHEWEMANLTDKDKVLRRVSFAIFSAPFLWAMYDPVAVREYFDVALASMPEWYIQIYLSIVGGVWGFAALKNSLPGIVGGIRGALKDNVGGKAK